MKQLNWDSFEKKIFINSSPLKLYQLWASSSGITKWFLSKADYHREGALLDKNETIQPGDAYTWYWHNWNGNEKGTILEANGEHRIKFSFAGDCDVLVTFEPHGSSTLLSLKQSNIPQDDKSKLEIFYGCSNGWTFWLANLKAYVEHGILLNETEFDLTTYELAGFQFVNM